MVAAAKKVQKTRNRVGQRTDIHTDRLRIA
jgi:hypothetical protein